ncbi:MAG: histidinol dehydrogenase [Methanomassiliicoccales archaeon]
MWGPIDLNLWERRRRGELANVRQAVENIIEAVRNRGDDALLELTERFDGVSLDSLKVCSEEIKAAYERVDESLVKALKEASDRIRRFHSLQYQKQNWLEEIEEGICLGVKLLPLDRVGAYVPGGRASYPSTALMCIIPAKVVGVSETVVCTPPPINPLTLVALDIAEVDEIYKIGGAQAIAAMAFGTKTIKAVRKVVGPGNVYVTEAKMLLRDRVEIDFPAGPSEAVIIADDSANPSFVASDIVAQAEHGPHSFCLLITNDEDFAKRVGEFVDKYASCSPRKVILESSLKNVGYILVDNMEKAVEICNCIAPEHISIQCKQYEEVLALVRNAGSIFIGSYSPIAAGDYASGTNHVLPTSGYANLYSGLDIRHFCKATSVQQLSKDGLRKLEPTIVKLASAEGLFGHAQSIQIRLDH